MFKFCSLFGISFDPQESVKCDMKDTSSRKEIIVYRVPEFLYSGISWVPQRDGSKKQTLYFVNVCWNSFCTHHRVWDVIFSFKKSKSLSTTESVAKLPPFGPIEGQKWFDQISSQWESQKIRFALIYFGKIRFLPPCIWNIPFMSYSLWTDTLASIYVVSSYLPPHTYVFCRTLVAKAELYWGRDRAA